MTPNTSPAAASLDVPREKGGRRRCRYSGCKKLFKPRKDTQHFCDKQCRYKFHKLGNAFGTLSKTGISKLLKHAKERFLKELPRLERKYFATQEKRIAELEGRHQRMVERITALQDRMGMNSASIEALARLVKELGIAAGLRSVESQARNIKGH